MKRLAVILLAFYAIGLPAQDTQPPLENVEQQSLYRKLLEEVRCMVCQNQNLKDSNAPLAKDMRRELRRMVEEGASEADVKQFLLDRYGDYVSLPSAAGAQHASALGWPRGAPDRCSRRTGVCDSAAYPDAATGRRMSAWVAFLLVAVVLGLAAVACVAVPLWRDRERPTSTAALTASSLVIPALGGADLFPVQQP